MSLKKIQEQVDLKLRDKSPEIVSMALAKLNEPEPQSDIGFSISDATGYYFRVNNDGQILNKIRIKRAEIRAEMVKKRKEARDEQKQKQIERLKRFKAENNYSETIFSIRNDGVVFGNAEQFSKSTKDFDEAYLKYKQDEALYGKD